MCGECIRRIITWKPYVIYNFTGVAMFLVSYRVHAFNNLFIVVSTRCRCNNLLFIHVYISNTWNYVFRV
ncbi:hypothetical protein BRADI_4g11122v3 [Brachypodium distachyon]|uniref:Uncharacterized protein n=1 Tax=Brachypodium distachyon TaxID=15368 RepID=A0A0Q3PDX3_BRADI|nr:hypothetical protein BRADI_4g11122v3 [Brachypodium distachyon]